MQKEQLSSERWESIFKEAKELGVSFILLAGGEPLMRREVIEKAAMVKEIIFPVFTNGTMLQKEYIKIFNENRNLIPILSIEGDLEQTDGRRGEGTYTVLMNVMEKNQLMKSQQDELDAVILYRKLAEMEEPI